MTRNHGLHLACQKWRLQTLHLERKKSRTKPAKQTHACIASHTIQGFARRLGELAAPHDARHIKKKKKRKSILTSPHWPKLEIFEAVLTDSAKRDEWKLCQSSCGLPVKIDGNVFPTILTEQISSKEGKRRKKQEKKIADVRRWLQLCSEVRWEENV